MSSESSVPRQFHLLSFEGPDLYARAGGVATRVVGVAEALANRVEAMRRSGLRTARQYTWQRVLDRHLFPCIGAFGELALDALRVA